MVPWFSERHAREGLPLLHAVNLADLRHDDVADRVVRVGLDFRNEVVFAEEGVEFDDVLDLDELLVDLFFSGRLDVNQHETNGRDDSLNRTYIRVVDKTIKQAHIMRGNYCVRALYLNVTLVGCNNIRLLLSNVTHNTTMAAHI